MCASLLKLKMVPPCTFGMYRAVDAIMMRSTYLLSATIIYDGSPGNIQATEKRTKILEGAGDA
jgi:hypothetical protein